MDCYHQPDRCPVGEFLGMTSGKRIGYKSRGTGKSHGFGSQYFLDTEDWLVRVRPADAGKLRDLMMERYILTEPLSVVWKMHREIVKHHTIPRIPG